MYTGLPILSVYLLLLPYFSVNKDYQTMRDNRYDNTTLWVSLLYIIVYVIKKLKTVLERYARGPTTTFFGKECHTTYLCLHHPHRSFHSCSFSSRPPDGARLPWLRLRSMFHDVLERRCSEVKDQRVAYTGLQYDHSRYRDGRAYTSHRQRDDSYTSCGGGGCGPPGGANACTDG